MRDTARLLGRRFGRLLVIAHANRRYWTVRCDCGIEKQVRDNHLTCKLTISCGCYLRETCAQRPNFKGASARKRRAAAEQRIIDGKKSCSRRACTQNNPQLLENFPINNTQNIDRRASWCKSCRRDEYLKMAFGISLADKNRLIADQDGRCANKGCNVELVMEGHKRNAHVDHDHRTGEIRGILCRDCNLGLGYMQDSPEMIMGLLEYARCHVQLRLVKG